PLLLDARATASTPRLGHRTSIGLALLGSLDLVVQGERLVALVRAVLVVGVVIVAVAVHGVDEAEAVAVDLDQPPAAARTAGHVAVDLHRQRTGLGERRTGIVPGHQRRVAAELGVAVERWRLRVAEVAEVLLRGPVERDALATDVLAEVL